MDAVAVGVATRTAAAGEEGATTVARHPAMGDQIHTAVDPTEVHMEVVEVAGVHSGAIHSEEDHMVMAW